MTYTTINVTKSDEWLSRGRNGWFRLDVVTVDLVGDGMVSIEGVSRRGGDLAPVILRLTSADARRLAKAIRGAGR